ncbi:hypothetical protein MNEG_16317 [Monoraphidium neglectum]|uniref:Uncharacterized protein n=1 Tax=Monoraphidium neglectum TaxID=145388 RepID=A0A0D2IUS1_9CHLO|nr:hypothetical protein MNEG_16317 [Monoraphidium neglectum]KIY91647.1 hypothetical protein MNEG_16317 [Monoraphidium neglectum]|eukprot:XP_013890667.1 hypothetical protein MNEG_16317 [Monoraphidium neglectum]
MCLLMRSADWQRNPLDGRTPLERGGAWEAQAAMPGRRLAAKIRARRLEREAAGSNLEGPLKEYNRRRGIVSSEGASEDGGGGGGGGGGKQQGRGRGGGRVESALVAEGPAAGGRGR